MSQVAKGRAVDPKVIGISVSKLLDMSGQFGWAFIGLTLVIGSWQALVILGGMSEVVLPSPLAVARVVVAFPDILFSHALFTLRVIVVGFGLSILIGFPIAIAIAFSDPLRKMFYPILIISNSIPKVAVAPLFIIWLGFGEATNVSITVLVAIFPIIINTALGLTEIDPGFIKLGRIMGGSVWRIFFKIRLPEALPSIFAGLKVAMTLATVGAVVGELVAGQEGLGYLSQFAAGQLQTPLVFASIVALSALGIILFYLVVLVEYLSFSWRR